MGLMVAAMNMGELTLAGQNLVPGGEVAVSDEVALDGPDVRREP